MFELFRLVGLGECCLYGCWSCNPAWELRIRTLQVCMDIVVSQQVYHSVPATPWIGRRLQLDEEGTACTSTGIPGGLDARYGLDDGRLASRLLTCSPLVHTRLQMLKTYLGQCTLVEISLAYLNQAVQVD